MNSSEQVAADYPWTSDEAGDRIRRHPGTIRRACREGDLHGSQSTKGGHWLIEEQCLQAYKRGEKCAHRQKVSRLGRRAA